MITVLIVEDHESMKDAIASALSATGRYQIIGALSSAGLAELFCERYSPDLVLMDICTEDDSSGITATEKLKKRFPKIKVIVMTGFDELSYVPRARQSGADGFLYKSKSLNFFIEITDKIMNGETYFPEPKVLSVPNGKAPLTEREMEVLRLICKAMTNAEIADELCISESTVKFHKSNMLEKTGFKTAMDLAFYMVSKGWINPLY